MRKTILILLISVAISIPYSLARAEGNTSVKMAVIDPFSGSFANVGLQTIATIRLDTARINKNGGINGHKLEIVPFDDALSVPKALIQFHKAVDEGIRYISQGASSGIAGALLHATNEHNQRDPNNPILYFNYASADMNLTNADCSFWFFRFASNQLMTIGPITTWIANQKDIHKVFLLNENYSFGQSLAKDAVELLKKKRPGIKIVGNTFIPLNKVKDFAPYLVHVKASGADVLITGNYGSDLTLLAKAAASLGMKIPIITYYAENGAGTVKGVGRGGVNRLYVLNSTPGNYNKHPILAERDVKLYKSTGYNYLMMSPGYMLDSFQLAADDAQSIEPIKVAFALEHTHFEAPEIGKVSMRADNHQLVFPMFMSVLKEDMKPGIGGTKLGFQTVASFSPSQVTFPTTCRMHRPKMAGK